MDRATVRYGLLAALLGLAAFGVTYAVLDLIDAAS